MIDGFRVKNALNTISQGIGLPLEPRAQSRGISKIGLIKHESGAEIEIFIRIRTSVTKLFDISRVGGAILCDNKRYEARASRRILNINDLSKGEIKATIQESVKDYTALFKVNNVNETLIQGCIVVMSIRDDSGREIFDSERIIKCSKQDGLRNVLNCDYGWSEGRDLKPDILVHSVRTSDGETNWHLKPSIWSAIQQKCADIENQECIHRIPNVDFLSLGYLCTSGKKSRLFEEGQIIGFSNNTNVMEITLNCEE